MPWISDQEGKKRNYYSGTGINPTLLFLSSFSSLLPLSFTICAIALSIPFFFTSCSKMWISLSPSSMTCESMVGIPSRKSNSGELARQREVKGSVRTFILLESHRILNWMNDSHSTLRWLSLLMFWLSVSEPLEPRTVHRQLFLPFSISPFLRFP